MKFIDTNVLVYVADDADAAKQSVSREIVREALTTNGCLISAQVLNEFSSVLFKKLKKTNEEVDGFLEVIEGIKSVAVKPEWRKPPTFALFVNDTELSHFSYERYIENQIRRNFGFEGTPIKILMRNKKGEQT